MKNIVIVSLFLLCACGGKLSEEQRKELRKGMEQQKIVKLSDAEITELALDQGRSICTALEKKNIAPSAVDSIAREYHVKIRWITPGSKNALAIEQQLIDAYISSIVTGSLQDNIQKLHNADDPRDYDSLVYSKPVVSTLPDGVENLEGIWNIYMSRKNVILGSAH